MKKQTVKNTKRPKGNIISNVVNYPVGDFLIRLKNAAVANKHEIVVAKTLLIYEVAKLLQKSGYIASIKEEMGNLKINLAYIKKEPVLLNIRLISKPGLRIYKNVKDLEKYKSPSILIISTPKGLMTGSQALKSNVGGEVIAEIK